MFGENLRKLAAPYGSISELSRQLGINRTQFNRYLAGESFPRPDVLARVCAFFEVDARVLLEPVESIEPDSVAVMHPFLRHFVTSAAENIPPSLFPAGFYRFSRRSFMRHDVFIMAIVHIRRKDSFTYMRGYETPDAMKVQALPTTALAREFRGLVMRQDNGIVIIASRRNSMTCSFSYLSQVASFDNNYWVGYATRTVPENADGLRATRMVFEFLGPRARDALPAARATGFHTEAELPAFHRHLLKPDVPFS